MKNIVIYHANCADGFGAAWCFWNKFGDTWDYHPGVYGAEPPDVTGRSVYLVDFSYKREVVERKHHKDIAELLGVCRRSMVIGGYRVPVASLPYTLSSDAGHVMAQGEAFAACYWDTDEHRVFSLRSAEDGVDVADIASDYGGGGHKHAAGFKVPRSHALAQA